MRKLTIAQFAKMNNVNKRTLHYYDEIGLFSPSEVKENGYRMYDLKQSLDFEYIRMCKELDMSIEEIKDYYQHPSPEKFLDMAKEKITDLDQKINQLKQLKKTLTQKQKQITFCESLKDQEIHIETLNTLTLSTLPLKSNNDLSSLFSTFKDYWNIEQIRDGIGGYISLDKIKTNNYTYDGFFTYAKRGHLKLPKAEYLCGYQKGPFDKVLDLYQKMFEYADNHGIKLDDTAYEIGMNEFVISKEEDYITKVFIRIIK